MKQHTDDQTQRNIEQTTLAFDKFMKRLPATEEDRRAYTQFSNIIKKATAESDLESVRNILIQD